MDDANPSPLDRESESVEDPLFASFHKSNEYLATLSPFLAADLFVEPSPAQQSDEGKTLGRLTAILDEHQEQSYLLDPFLEQLVGPPVESLRAYAREAVRTGHQGSRVRVAALAKLIYWYTKTRGYKTIVRYFPHEPSDLTVVLGLISLPDSYAGLEWELCYVLLLWLSLISMLPFDLTLFDERGSGMPVAQQIESVARERLSKPGKERDAAAVLLARLYIRKDTCTLVGPFLEWAESEVNNDQNIGSAVLGILQVISELLKLSTLSMLSNHLPTVQRILSDINTSPAFSGNTLIRKQSAKIASRLSLLLLPPARSAIKSSWKALDTAEHVEQHAVDDLRTQQLEADVPEEVDSHIEDLVTFLQDKDTIVRWSAAKGLARISERLPPEFACQILDTIVGLFSIHDTTSDGQDYIPAAEGTWHGATLSCAEFARRRLVDKSRLPEVLSWASKGLQFDVRKGAVSVGSNVRDAAAYVLWALARSHEADVLRPWATSLAQRLVAVSLFDREIHIRRAASAAFQENVGRMGLFPHGIDVLQKTDFYAVSLRKHAFEVAAWQVAEHEEYRGSLISHLESITLKHWDPSMRSLAARALRRICELQLQTLGPAVASRQGKLLQGADATGVHGALLALGELAAAFRDHPSHEELEATRLQVFRQLADIPITRLRSYRGELLLGAACLVVAASVSKAALELGAHGPPWKDILDSGLKNRNSDVQNAAAEAWSSVSRLVDSSEQVQR